MSCLVSLNLFPANQLKLLESIAQIRKNNHEQFWVFLDQHQIETGYSWENWSGWSLAAVIDMLADKYSIDLKTPGARFVSLSAILSDECLYQFYFLDMDHRQRYLKMLNPSLFSEAEVKKIT